jgi:hypothetical protein
MRRMVARGSASGEGASGAGEVLFTVRPFGEKAGAAGALLTTHRRHAAEGGRQYTRGRGGPGKGNPKKLPTC